MAYHTVGVISKPTPSGTLDSLVLLIDYLRERGCKVLVDDNSARELNDPTLTACDLVTIGREADLAVVVGGDGSMIGAARVLARFNVQVVGVNRGNLGFLADINPSELSKQLDLIFAGEVNVESRYLLDVEVLRHDQPISQSSAVNEVVLHHGKVAHMMEFELYIDGHFVYSQRSDGLIVATPTGSTAYSLSGGGPILMPHLDVLTLVPMFPHTLSSRPIVVDANSQLSLRVSKANRDNLQVSCDSHVVLPVFPGDEIRVRKSQDQLLLAHPKSYNYFTVLRNKLGWGSKIY